MEKSQKNGMLLGLGIGLLVGLGMGVGASSYRGVASSARLTPTSVHQQGEVETHSTVRDFLVKIYSPENIWE